MMNQSDMDNATAVDTYMDYLFASLGLAVRDEWRPEVKNYFLLGARMAHVLDAYPQEITEDLAPVFRA
ncbi:MAG: DUF4089 domain-containing protein [Acidithiobacillus sp.]